MYLSKKYSFKRREVISLIKLIRNELYKIFHKKNIYITLIITILFGLLLNFIYDNDFDVEDLYETNYKMDKDIVADYEKEHDTKNDDYVSSKSYVLLYESAMEFGKDSWQRYILLNDGKYNYDLMSAFNEILSYENGLSFDKNSYAKALKERDELLNKLKDISWKDYALEEKEELTSLSLEDPSSSPYYQASIEALDLRLKYDIIYKDDQLNQYLSDYESSRSVELQYSVMDEKDMTEYQKTNLEQSHADVEILKYQIENGIVDSSQASLQYILGNYLDEYFIMIVVIIILISGSIISEEFSKGTIKLLLVKPYSRTEILMSKYITSLIMVLFAIGSTFLIQFILGGLFFGFDSLNIPVIIYDYGKEMVVEMSVFKSLASSLLCLLPELILIATIAFTCSTIFVSNNLASTLSYIIVFGSNIINSIAQVYEIDILKYFVTLNWDFRCYLYGGSSPYKGLTLPFSMVVCLVYVVLLIVLAIFIFNKRNIKNI